MPKRERVKCFGFIHDGKKGCRWLSISPSERECTSCSFYKTEQEFYEAQNKTNERIANMGLVTYISKDNLVKLRRWSD